MLKISSLAMLVSGIVFVSSCSPSAQTEESSEEATEMEESSEETKAPASPRANIESEIAGGTVTVDWGSPAVKERAVWGELVPFDKVWRAGANETTNVEFSTDVVIGETTVPAGKYGMFIIPAESGDWTVIINTDWSQEEHGIWGSMGYNEEHDVARVNIAPTWSEESTERLEFSVSDNSINFAWEKARLSIPVAAAE